MREATLMLHWKSDIGSTLATPFPPTFSAGNAPGVNSTVGLAGQMSACRDFAPNAEIFSQYEVVSDVYCVVSGAVRFSKMMKDGRRQIGAFYFPGDLFGLESEDRHSFSAESIVSSRVRGTKRAAFLKA